MISGRKGVLEGDGCANRVSAFSASISNKAIIGSYRGSVTRAANLNGTPRVFGGAELRDWFCANFEMYDQVKVLVLSPSELQIIEMNS